MTIKKGDFIELDYTGKSSEDDKVFETTIQQVAEDSGLLHKHEPGHNHDHSDQYHSVIVCIGERQLLPGLDAKIIGLDKGKHSIKLNPDEAFGRKNPKLLKMMPLNVLKQHKIEPYVGLVLNVDDQYGIVRSVSAGRVIIDFNHPLASKDVEYEVDIKRIVTDDKEKLEALLKMVGLPYSDLNISGKEATLKITAALPEQYIEMFATDAERITGLKITMTAEKEDNKESKKEPKTAANQTTTQTTTQTAKPAAKKAAKKTAKTSSDDKVGEN